MHPRQPHDTPTETLAQHLLRTIVSTNSRGTCTNAGDLHQLRAGPPENHRHTGIGLHTPADVHYGLATDKAAQRRTVMADAHARHPHRFGTTRTPKILDLPDTVWINRPAQHTTQEPATTAA